MVALIANASTLALALGMNLRVVHSSGVVGRLALIPPAAISQRSIKFSSRRTTKDCSAHPSAVMSTDTVSWIRAPVRLGHPVF